MKIFNASQLFFFSFNGSNFDDRLLRNDSICFTENFMSTSFVLLERLSVQVKISKRCVSSIPSVTFFQILLDKSLEMVFTK